MAVLFKMHRIAAGTQHEVWSPRESLPSPSVHFCLFIFLLFSSWEQKDEQLVLTLLGRVLFYGKEAMRGQVTTLPVLFRAALFREAAILVLFHIAHPLSFLNYGL